MDRTLTRRMFRAAARATNEAVVNARLGALYDAALVVLSAFQLVSIITKGFPGEYGQPSWTRRSQ